MSRLRPERRAVYENAVFRTTEHTVSKIPSPRCSAALSPRLADDMATAFLTLFAIFGLTGWIPPS